MAVKGTPLQVGMRINVGLTIAIPCPKVEIFDTMIRGIEMCIQKGTTWQCPL